LAANILRVQFVAPTALRRMRAADQQHVARVLARSVVDLVHRSAEARLAGESVGHHERQLLIRQAHRLARFGQNERALDDDHQQFRPLGSRPIVYAPAIWVELISSMSEVS